MTKLPSPTPLPADDPMDLSAGIDAQFERYGPAYRWLVTISGMAGAMSMILSATMVNVAVPSIMGAYGVGQDVAQWAATAFISTMVASQLLNAWLTGAFGRRFTFTLTLLMFILGSIVCALAPNIDTLIAGRIMQGFAAGVIQPLVMTTIVEVFPVNRRGFAVGLYGMGVTLAPSFGPLCGGLVIDALSWRHIFMAPLPLVIFAVVMGLAFMPVAAILDTDLTLSLPKRVTADTGIDALTHAIEAYVSRKASPFSDQQALAAMRLIAPNLRRAFQDGEDREAREALLIGACFGGIAFSNASVALVHGMSRPIGAFFHVPHGLSNAMLLPAVTAWSIPAAPQRYANCARAMGLVGETTSDDIANAALLDELRALNDELGVPTPAGFGIQPERWQQSRPLMAEQALASGSPGNNPRSPTADEIIALYDEVWG